MKILYAEDEEKIATAVVAVLKMEGYAVDWACDGDAAINFILNNYYDVFVLDIMMPGKTGLDVLREARDRQIYTPALLLTAKGTIDDKIAGFDCGADDYLGKPFVMQELIARVSALGRRQAVYTGSVVFGDLELNCAERILNNGKTRSSLSEKECKAARLLMTLSEVPKDSLPFDDGAEEVLYIEYLRKKMGSGFVLLETERGYKLCKQPSA